MMQREIKVSPSLLAADFLRLSEELEMINRSEADWIHLDIMDGVFVPNLSFGFSVLDSVAKVVRKPMDVHFMNVNPEDYIERTARLGAMMMNFHIETRKLGTTGYDSTCYTLRTNTSDIIRMIHHAGMKAAVTLRPDTPVEAVRPYIEDVEMVLLMGVYPGFGGQKFIEATVGRVRELKAMINETGSHALIEVDGGVHDKTAPRLIEAGCDVLVSGSYVFNATDPNVAIQNLKQKTRA